MGCNRLIHYGIKGQRWGVRRYQNKDGTLTAAGKNRRNLYARTLPKGTVMYRAVRNGSKRFMDRNYTYVSVTDDFWVHSYNTSSGFDGEFDTDFKLQSTRSLKIASVNDYFDAVIRANNINPEQYLNQIPEKTINKGKYIMENLLLDHKLIEGAGGNYDALNNAVEYLRKNGFDGVVDPIDGAIEQREGGAPVSTIIFNPGENLEIVEERKIY